MFPARLRSVHPLIPLFIAYFVIGTFFAISLPIFEGADEIDHYLVIETIADEGRLPNVLEDRLTVGHEVGQPPLYYVLLAPLIRGVDRSDVDEVVEINPHYGHLNSTSVWIHRLDPAVERSTWTGPILAVRLGRFASLTLSALTIWATFQIGLHLFDGDRHWAGIGAALVGLNPQFIAISATLNNDNLVIPLASVLLWLSLELHRRVGAAVFGIGVVWGLAILGKASALAFGGVFALIFLRELWTHRHLLPILIKGGLLTAGLLTSAGWWFWRNWTLYGDPLGLSALSLAHEATYRDTRIGLLETLAEASQVLRSFWLGPGNFSLFGPTWLYWLFNGLLLLGLVLWGASWLRDAERSKRQSEALLVVWTILILGLLLYWISGVKNAGQGRLIFPAISAIMLLATAGFRSLGRVGLGLTSGFTAVLFATAVLAPFLLIRPAFAWPEPLSTAESLPNRFGEPALTDEIEVLGHASLTRSVSIGESPQVEIFWNGTRPVPKSYFVTLLLIDSAGVEVSRYEGYPAGGNYLTPVWVEDRPFRETYVMPPIDENAAPGLATVLVELVEWNGTFRIGGRPLADQIKIRSGEDAVEPEFQAGVTYGDTFTLSGYDLTRTAESLDLRLIWESRRNYPAEYTVFVHLINANGQLVAQADGVPRAGTWPTAYWEAGERIQDDRRLSLEGIEPGEYTLAIGFYDPISGARLLTDGVPSLDRYEIPVTLPAAP